MRKIKLLFLLFGLIIWFIGAIALNLIYTTKKMRDAYASPNVRVQLSEPIYGVSGITPINNGDFYLKKIDNVFVAARSNGYLFSTKDCQAYVSMEKSVLIILPPSLALTAPAEYAFLLMFSCPHQTFREM